MRRRASTRGGRDRRHKYRRERPRASATRRDANEGLTGRIRFLGELQGSRRADEAADEADEADATADAAADAVADAVVDAAV